MRRKRLCTAIVVMFVLGVLAFPVFAADPKDDDQFTIAYVRPTNEPYYKFGFDGVEMMAEMMGIELLGYISDMKPEREIASIEDAITQQVDGIVLMSVSASAIVAAVKKADEAGVPLQLLFGFNADYMDRVVGSVQADCALSGSTMGKWVAENVSGGEVAVIMGLPGRGDAECYRDKFIEEAEKNPKIKIVASVPGDWNRQKAFNQMQNLITSNPDLKAVFVQNEDMSMGAIKALEEAGKAGQVMIVSQNGSPYGLDSIAAGGIKSTVGWSPSQEAQLALRNLVDHLDGKESFKLIVTPMKIITEKNVGDAVPWEPTEASTRYTLNLDLGTLRHDFY